MRAIGTERISENERILITFEGRAIAARRGETIAAALSAAGVHALRETRTGAERGLFCGMGVCQECRVRVDGEDGVRACMRRVDRPLTVTRQPPRAAASQMSVDAELRATAPLALEVLVIGAGAAGLAAATTAARAGADVLVVDERPAPGGQFYKQLAASPDLAPDLFADRQMQSGRDRILRAREAGASFLAGAEVVAAFQPMRLLLRTPEGMRTVTPKRLIVATGAYERGLAVPGWTLPGVVTTGALQTLVRSYRVLPGKRILIAGNGPLNLQVALEAAAAGAEVVAVVEAARPSMATSATALLHMLSASPALALKGAALRAALALRKVPYFSGTRLGTIAQRGDGLRATLVKTDGEQAAKFDADIVTMGYGFQPSNEVLRLLGCRFESDDRADWLAPGRDEDGMTTVPGVYAAGDCVTFGGAFAAESEGEIAGLAAARSLGLAGSGNTAELHRKLARHRRFQRGLWQYYAAPAISPDLQPAETIICRCEEVTRADLDKAREDGAAAIGNLKRATRAGMGPCQGRYCGGVGRAMLSNPANATEEAHWASRPPVKPVAIAELIAALQQHEA